MSFRIVKTLNDNQVIIGLNDVRRFDLTRRFRHLFVDGQYTTDERSNQSKQSTEVELHKDKSTSDEEGEDAGKATMVSMELIFSLSRSYS